MFMPSRKPSQIFSENFNSFLKKFNSHRGMSLLMGFIGDKDGNTVEC
jgi:hypothetical protein